MLQIKPLCVCEITAVLDLAPSTVSKHLTLLRDAGLIEDKKEGRWVTYMISPEGFSPYADEINNLLSQWLTDDSVIQADAGKVERVEGQRILC